MRLRDWFYPPRHVMAIFLAVVIVSAGALALLVRLLFEQQKAVENQRKQERLEQDGGRAVTAMQDALANLRTRFETGTAEFPTGIALVHLEKNEIRLHPDGWLLYYPEVPLANSARDPRLDVAERLEFSGNDQRAAEAYESLARASEREIRAAAFNGLARLHRKGKNIEAALHDYNNIAQLTDVRIDGLPSGLLAVIGRASVFETGGQKSRLHQEATLLDENLGVADGDSFNPNTSSIRSLPEAGWEQLRLSLLMKRTCGMPPLVPKLLTGSGGTNPGRQETARNLHHGA